MLSNVLHLKYLAEQAEREVESRVLDGAVTPLPGWIPAALQICDTHAHVLSVLESAAQDIEKNVLPIAGAGTPPSLLVTLKALQNAIAVAKS